jgi:hypothetical protein
LAQITVRKTFKINGVYANVTSVAMNAVANITPTSAGIYENTFTGLTAGAAFVCTIVYVYGGETYTEVQNLIVPTAATTGTTGMTLNALIIEVQALTGRTGDTELITSARIVRFLNDAQTEIVKACTGHIDLETKKANAITLVTGTYSYSFASITPAVYFPLTLYYMNGSQSKELLYRDTEDFDRDYPDPTLQSGIPREWTRRGSTIEVWPLPTSAENGKYLRLDYTKTPTAFTLPTSPAALVIALATSSVLTESDKGLIYYAVAEVYRAIGGKKQEADDSLQYFYGWLEEYKKLKDGRFMAECNRIFD